MKVKIYAGLPGRLFYGRRIREMRFYPKKDDSGKYYQRHIDDKDKDELKKIKRFCRFRPLKVSISDDSMERSTTYRYRFFCHNRGIAGRGMYLCAYCGKLLRKDKVCVDHIIPVYLANSRKKYRKALERRGIPTVNDIRNLASSCASCNGRKGASGGLWILRGRFGRSWVRVAVKEIILLIIGSIVLYYLYGLISSTFADMSVRFIVSFFIKQSGLL
ncbi:MAG: HNH endonuclease [Clostridia bacterium]|nr:HNH endonuclease [Clostridia bacterium]